MQHRDEAHDDQTARRRDVMRLCAEAGGAELAACVTEVACDLAIHDMRRPEPGLVMLRGRMGGDGAPFNLGEATVTRAAVQVEGGASGFAYHLGRDAAKARHAAIIDALWQDPARRDLIETHLGPIGERVSAEATRESRQTAATRVDFFTLVRGED